MYRCIVWSKGLAGTEDKEDFEKLEKKAHPDSVRYPVMIVEYWYLR